MARILVGEIEVGVSEDVDDVLNRIVGSRDGIRLGSGTIVAPPGWLTLTESDTGEPLYVQASRVGYVRPD
jgi:hypothetical protein